MPGSFSSPIRAATAGSTPRATYTNRPGLDRSAARVCGSRSSTAASLPASSAGSVTSAGSANTALAGNDIASSCPLRSNIEPREGGRAIWRTRWLRASSW